MEKKEFSRAYYIKLGSKGIWEEPSIREGKARVGWTNIPLDEINQRDWNTIYQKYLPNYKNKNVATMDINALKSFVESTQEDIWITFHASQLWWGKLADGSLQEDAISRYRMIDGNWQKHDLDGNPLLINQIPGNISKVQGFRAVICKVNDLDDLKRLINNIPSDDFTRILQARDELITQIESGFEKITLERF